MNLFTLISKKEVHPPEGKKIIRKKDFTTLQKAIDLLKKVQKEAENFRLDTMKECEILKTKTAKEGFEEGLSLFNKTLLQLDKEIKSLRKEFQKQVFSIALESAKKILGSELKLHPDRITDIVIQTLKPVTQHHRVKIYVNKEDLEILEKNRPQIKKIFEHLEVLTIEERNDVQPGGCIIETEGGIINAQLENQWRSLQKAFKTLEKKS